MKGVPDELQPRLDEWLSMTMQSVFDSRTDTHRLFALKLGIQVDSEASIWDVIHEFQYAMDEDDIFAFDVIDELLAISARVGSLSLILDVVDHELTVAKDGRGLEFRVPEETQQIYATAVSENDHASTLLKSAWAAAFSRDSDPKRAWEQATESVEFLLKPVVSPKDKNATISKMAAALRDAPQKWECAVPAMHGLSSVESFAKLLDIVGHNPGKHGSEEQIDLLTSRTVVLQAITVCQWLREEALWRVK